MKKVTVLLSAFIILSCHKKAVPTIATRQTDPPSSIQTANMVADIDAGRTTFTVRCGRCHDLPDPLKYNVQRWNGILSVMIPRARLMKEEVNNVSAYIKANAKKD
jgi:mono/diheme cytochrome c family protein